MQWEKGGVLSVLVEGQGRTRKGLSTASAKLLVLSKALLTPPPPTAPGLVPAAPPWQLQWLRLTCWEANKANDRQRCCLLLLLVGGEGRGARRVREAAAVVRPGRGDGVLGLGGGGGIGYH